MKERWLDLDPGSDEKQQTWFADWIRGESIHFQDTEAEEKYRERAEMIRDTVRMDRLPRRVPVSPSIGYFPLEYSGVSYFDMMYNPKALLEAWKKYYDDFEPDTFRGPLGLSGRVLEHLDFRLYKWPGHGLPENREFQYVEKEYMTPDEYQDLIDDPTGWFLSVYFPRIFGSLKNFNRLPLLPNVNEIPMVLPAVLPFARSELRKALKSLMEAGEAAAEWGKELRPFNAAIMGRGYPAMGGGFVKAPFDVIGDTLRGTIGIMTDMFRYPDEVKEACERLAPLMVKAGIAAARATGAHFITLPLHKGADGFMSEEQFLTFYWPTLRKVLIGLMDEGLVPAPFAEGSYNSRLEIISELPKGKCIWYFDKTDMARAKETIGRVACLQGNVPLDLMAAGTPEEVKSYCRELIEVAGEDGGFILSTGAGLQGARTENVKAFIDAGKEYGVY
jgi:hypothetical protein